MSKRICNRVVTETKAPPVVQPAHAVLPDGTLTPGGRQDRAVLGLAWVLPLVANEDCAEQREDRAKLPQHEVPPGVRAPVAAGLALSARQFRQGLGQAFRRRAELRILHRRPVAAHVNRIHHRQRASHPKYKAEEGPHRRGPEGRHPPSLAAQRGRVCSRLLA
jgi:hypothetical protein